MEVFEIETCAARGTSRTRSLANGRGATPFHGECAPLAFKGQCIPSSETAASAGCLAEMGVHGGVWAGAVWTGVKRHAG